MLLRLKDSLAWKCTLWTIVGVQVCMLIVGTTMHLVMCQPISARWLPSPTAKCIPTANFMIYGYVYSGERLSVLSLTHMMVLGGLVADFFGVRRVHCRL